MVLIWFVLFGTFSYSSSEYAGPLCTSETIPATYAGGTQTSSTGGKSFFMQDENYMFTCCGVVDQWKVNTKAAGTLTIQIWRHQGSSSFELISQQDYTVTSGANTISTVENNKVSVREGDLIGWYSGTADLVRYSTLTTIQNNRYDSSQVAMTVGSTHDWNAANVLDGVKYSIQATMAATSNPYFKNLPTFIQKADTQMNVGGISLLTLTVNDPDLADNSSLTVSISPEWTDFFNLDASNLVTTARQLTPGTYMPVFRVEEAHCGVGFSATLTVSVYDSMPSITNLPASTNVHEDVVDQTLLYTVSTTDPMNQAIWCEGDWTIGTPPNKPFIVKMTSLVPGSSTAGIYLIEWPYLDYDTVPTYELVVKCYDTFENTATGTFSVNILQNQAPVFSNLGNMVEINATSAKIGDTVFTVSATDADSDQILYESSCSPSTTPDGNCPFEVYDSGEVRLKANVLTWDTNKFTLSITAKANNDTITARDLIIYITNQNNLPVITNVNGVTLNVAENQAVSTPLLQVTTTDADSDPITYFYDITPDAGYALFECTSSGLVRTHSSNMINLETLATATYTMRIYAHDTKEMSNEMLTLVITNVNEPVTFNQPSYGITIPEESAMAVSTYISSTDPDAGDTATYSMNCGTYNSYFTLTTATMTVTFAQTYDLDPGYLPDEVPCAVYVQDSGGYNDTTTLFIRISYVNDNSPIFAGGPTYNVQLGTDTPVGYLVVSAVANDADRESDTIVNYSLSPDTFSGATIHVQSGHVYAKTDFSAVAAGVYVFNVIATDGTNTATATVSLTITTTTTPDADTSNRYYNFFDDTRNILWFAAAALTFLGLVFVVVLMIIFFCKEKKTPLFGDLKAKLKACFTFEQKPKRQTDRHQRKKPLYGRQHTPTYRHLHARELLRASPVGSTTPDLYSDAATRPYSSSSTVYGKVAVSQVNLRAKTDERNSNHWTDESGPGIAQSSTQTSTAQPKSSDKDSINPGKRRRRNSRVTPDISLPMSPSVTLPEPSTADITNGNRPDSQTYLDDDDDFRSERLSIAVSRNSTLNEQ